MIDDKDLCRAMRLVVKDKEKEPEADQEKLEAMYELFSSTAPRFEFGPGTLIDRPIDIRFRSRFRLIRLLNRDNPAWREWDLQTLMDWIVENWELIVRTLISLIVIIL